MCCVAVLCACACKQVESYSRHISQRSDLLVSMLFWTLVAPLGVLALLHWILKLGKADGARERRPWAWGAFVAALGALALVGAGITLAIVPVVTTESECLAVDCPDGYILTAQITDKSSSVGRLLDGNDFQYVEQFEQFSGEEVDALLANGDIVIDEEQDDSRYNNRLEGFVPQCARTCGGRPAPAKASNLVNSHPKRQEVTFAATATNSTTTNSTTTSSTTKAGEISTSTLDPAPSTSATATATITSTIAEATTTMITITTTTVPPTPPPQYPTPPPISMPTLPPTPPPMKMPPMVPTPPPNNGRSTCDIASEDIKWNDACKNILFGDERGSREQKCLCCRGAGSKDSTIQLDNLFADKCSKVLVCKFQLLLGEERCPCNEYIGSKICQLFEPTVLTRSAATSVAPKRRENGGEAGGVMTTSDGTKICVGIDFSIGTNIARKNARSHHLTNNFSKHRHIFSPRVYRPRTRPQLS